MYYQLVFELAVINLLNVTDPQRLRFQFIANLVCEFCVSLFTLSTLCLKSLHWKSTEMTDVHANVTDLRVYKTWHSRGLINDLPMLSTQYILLQSAELIADNQL